MRFDEARCDAHVGRAPFAVQPHRDVRAEPAAPGDGVAGAGVVVDDPDGVDDGIAEHGPQLGVGVRPVGAGGDEHHDVVEIDDAVELVEQGGDHQVPRLRAGDVAGRDRHGLPALHPLAQRWSGHRRAQRGAKPGAGIGRGGLRCRRHDVGVVGQVDG